MLVQPPRQLATDYLLEPEIPGRTEPQLPSGEWGINLAAAKGNFPDKGLKVHIPIWSTKGLGDKVELLLANNPVDQHTISDPTEVDEPTILWIGPGRLQTGAYQMTYRVTRRSQAPETYTPQVKLYVKLELPGGQDLDPVEGQHSAFYMYIDPQIVLDGVDKDIARAGVKITVQAKPDSGTARPYPNIAVGDVCTLSWGGKYVFSAPVTQEQINDPVGHPIVITVDEQTILDAHDTGPDGLAVTFMVRDLVDNQSEDWCKETRIVVDTGNSRLRAPIIAGTNGNNLDLEALGDEDVVAQVWAESIDDFAQNDTIIMNLRGTSLEGEPVDIEVRRVISSQPPTVVFVSLPNASARSLAKTQGVFSYKLERGGSTIQRSKGRFINMIGEPRRLAAPIAEDEQQGAINPDLLQVLIRIPFDDAIKPDMAIELIWTGTLAGNGTYEPELAWYFPTPEEIEARQDFFITVDGRHLKILEGGTLALSYNLLRGEGDLIIRRGSRPAALLIVGQARPELAKPIVLGVENNALEPDDLPNGVSQLTVPRPVETTQPGDVVTFTWVGSVTGKVRDSINITSHNADQDVLFTLNTRFVAEHIEANRDGIVTVWYDIARVGPPARSSYSQALVFDVGEATLTEDITDFEDEKWGGWERGPGLDPRDWEIRFDPSGKHLFNNTFTDQSDGIVLQKTIANLKVGQRYEFSIMAIRIGVGRATPSLSLRTSYGALTEPTELTTTWTRLAGTFTPTAPAVVLMINSHEASGVGNDYAVDDLTIKRAP